jgi:glutathione S-transferase
MKLTPEQREVEYAKSPSKRRTEFKRDVVANGLESKFIQEAVEYYDKMLHWADDALKDGPYLAGDAYSLADAAVIPYVLRAELLRMSQLWDRYPRVGEWWGRMKHRPSVDEGIWSRMDESDWAPFKSIQDDPWPKVQGFLKAA